MSFMFRDRKDEEFSYGENPTFGRSRPRVNFFAIGYIVRDPFVKPSRRVVVVRATCLESAVGFVMAKLRQFYKHFDVYIPEGYVEL